MSTSRLGYDNYERPKKTYTDTLSKDDIEDKLNGYKQIEDIYKVPLGSHLRYFLKNKDKKYVFRLGGFLFRNEGLPKYIVMEANGKTWSVQVKNTIFYQKMSQREINDTYEDKLEELENKNKALVSMIKELKKKKK